MRTQASLEKTIMLGKIKDRGKRGRPSMSLQELSRDFEDRALSVTHSQDHQRLELTQ